MATLDIKSSGVGCPQSAIESAANISLTVRLIMQGKVSSIFYLSKEIFVEGVVLILELRITVILGLRSR
jgi:hypothetical protein